MDANTLTTKLHAVADRKLHEHIVQMLHAVRTEIREKLYHNQIRTAFYYSPNPGSLKVHIDDALKEIERTLFEELAPTWRNKEVDEFMRKVENLQQQVDEIKDQLPV
jgi:polyhydroxyalkanoate synthesis regulator phasin